MTQFPKNIEMKKTAELVHYIGNSRTHSKEQILKIGLSIKEFGFTNPILIDSGNNIIAGHGRLMAAIEQELEEIPCLIIDYMTEAQKKAYVIADNRLALDAGWDKDLLKLEMLDLKNIFDFDLKLSGFGIGEIEAILADEIILEPEDVKKEKVAVLKFGDIKVPMTDAELNGIISFYEEYMREYENPMGFVAELIRNKAQGF